MSINKETYYLFRKHGSELLWLNEPSRVPRPKGTNEQTDKDFMVLESLDENMDLFYNEYSSEKLKKQYVKLITSLKTKVTDEVFLLIEEKYKK